MQHLCNLCNTFASFLFSRYPNIRQSVHRKAFGSATLLCKTCASLQCFCNMCSNLLQHLCNLCNICESLIEHQLVVQCSCTKLVQNLCNLSINLVQNSCNIGCKTCAICVQHFCARFLQHVQNLFKTSTTILLKLCIFVPHV